VYAEAEALEPAFGMLIRRPPPPLVLELRPR
jgi:hypothetical protein